LHNPLKSLLLAAALACIALPASLPAFAQSPIGAEFKVSTLGIGGELALQVLPRANLRAGFHVFDYDRTFDKDGIRYDGGLDFRSVSANFDVYLAGPFHVGAGLLIYNGFQGNAAGSAPPGQTFTLGNASFVSSTTAPVTGTLALKVNRVAPQILFGFGNPVPRNGRRVTVNVDLGIVFQGAPETTLALNGLACVPPNSAGPTCVDAAANPIVQANIQAEQNKLNDDFSPLQYYPVISFGIGYRF
jgi:hypothetical protein